MNELCSDWRTIEMLPASSRDPAPEDYPLPPSPILDDLLLITRSRTPSGCSTTSLSTESTPDMQFRSRPISDCSTTSTGSDSSTRRRPLTRRQSHWCGRCHKVFQTFRTGDQTPHECQTSNEVTPSKQRAAELQQLRAFKNLDFILARRAIEMRMTLAI
ncbi:uncharacterized protein MYCFIDRAFT_212501 [Pseudocercospora fijiensis CIRAD86]|uniref:Uncharacterized protein n=1 Tax=Pseudocercospora fijiensis (strain CIRAD86) TaxID=383855 RepID=M2ZIK6_PSEFD|nr:uncharacterized protein MYCFIDRAFT_212501 [Pseudocercospora fijiensis CIRAD86]EME78949.1 hypothetical protein MYCFIDRAFT_212501 [Pseudocercospora fijiensis CIRAD86]